LSELEHAKTITRDSAETHATVPEKPRDSARTETKNLNLRLSLVNYERFHALRRQIGLASNEATLVRLLDAAENAEKERGIEREQPNLTRLDELVERLDRITSRLEDMSQLLEYSRPIRGLNTLLMRAEQPPPIHACLTWQEIGKEWFPLEDNRGGA